MRRFVVIGPGRMGTALALAIQACGYEVTAACGNTASESSRLFRTATGCPVLDWTALSPYLDAADAVLVTVPDKAVTPVAQTLADSGWCGANKVVIHTAGALPSSALNPVLTTGALRLSLHPLQTMADPTSGPALLRGAYCTLEGDPDAVALGTTLVQAWGGIPAPIRPEQRPAYHAAAVLASNAVVALAAVAAEVSGLDDGLHALLPLMHGAVQNLARLGLPEALTGPVDRGDVSTVESHLHALQHNPTALSVYAALGIATANVARDKGSLPHAEWVRFTQLFESCLGGMSRE
jgi:predicted short-subunit dehydrogenase-like oxidoreductase (DUF2520 family)